MQQAEPLAAVVAPVPEATSSEPVPKIVQGAQELAQAIDACAKLKQKIIGLEAALEFARNELATAEASRVSAADTLRMLVDE